MFLIASRVVVIPAIVAVNVVVFVAMLASGVDALSPAVDQLLTWGGNFGPRTTTGEWWRLGSCTFVHAGIVHIGLNMYLLLAGGWLVERWLGRAAVVVIYVASGLAGSIASVIWYPAAVSVGASGAVFGIYGALFALVLRRRRNVDPATMKRLRLLAGLFLAFNLVIAFVLVDGVDMAAHLGGVVVGFGCGAAMAAERPRRRVVIGLAALVVAAFAVATVTVPQAMDARAELQRFLDLQQRIDSDYEKVSTGKLDPAQFALILEQDILPASRAMRARFASAGRTSAINRRKLERVRRYLVVKEELLALVIESVRTKDQSLEPKIRAKKRQTDQAMQRIVDLGE